MAVNITVENVSQTSIYVKAQSNYYNAKTFEWYLDNVWKATETGTSNGSGYYYDYYTFAGLSAGKTYKISVKVKNNNGVVVEENYIYATTQSASPPSAPSITAVPISKSKIDVYWGSVSGATGYHLYLNNAYRATITGTSYSFTGLSEYTQYTVGVSAYNANGESSISSTTVRTLDETPPTVSITSISKTNNSITISFVGSDAHSGVSGFYIYLNDSYRTTVYGTSGTYTYTGLQQGKLYKVSVKAFDNSGNVSSEDYRNIQTSANFEWDTPKTSGGGFNITAAEWNRFLDAINSARAGKGLTAYNFTYASKGGDFYAYMFNQAVQAISAMNPPISPPSTRSSGDEIYASYFNRLRDSLNSI